MENIAENYFPGKKELNPVVLIHGDFQNSTSFKGVEKMLQELGHTTLSFDLPGHGLSYLSEENRDLPTLLEKIILEKSFEKPILVGHSAGGILAVDYATRIENASSLVLLNCPLSNPKYMDNGIDLDDALEYYRNLTRDKFKKQALVNYYGSKINEEGIRELGLKTTDPKGFDNNAEFYLSLPDNQKIFDIEIPILFIASKDDSFVPLEYIETSVDKMKNGRLVIVEGGHNALITDPDEIEEVIRNNYLFYSGLETL